MTDFVPCDCILQRAYCGCCIMGVLSLQLVAAPCGFVFVIHTSLFKLGEPISVIDVNTVQSHDCSFMITYDDTPS